MPLYTRHCNACESEFPILCSMEAKSREYKCPECHSYDGHWVIEAPSLVRSDRVGNIDKKSGIHNVFDRIAKAHPTSEVAKR